MRTHRMGDPVLIQVETGWTLGPILACCMAPWTKIGHGVQNSIPANATWGYGLRSP